MCGSVRLVHTAFFEPAGPDTFAAMEWRYVSGGGITVPGPAAAWIRPAIPLLPGEEMSPMSRALLVADSGNGLSAMLAAPPAAAWRPASCPILRVPSAAAPRPS